MDGADVLIIPWDHLSKHTLGFIYKCDLPSVE